MIADDMDNGGGTAARARVSVARLVVSAIASLSLAGCAPAIHASRPTITPVPDPPPVFTGPPPISLAAADGTALTLRALAVRASIDEPLAFTELELTFDNPEGRQLDGRLSVVLPPGARLTRFARAAGPDAPWHEAEVVPRRTAYAALKSALGPQEPALAVRGGNLIARVDAIAAREPTRLIVAYVHELRGRSDAYRVPLAGLPALRELSLRVNSRTPVSVGGDAVVQKAEALGKPYSPAVKFVDLKPTRDLTLQFTSPREMGLRRDDMVVARLSPVPHDHNAAIDSLTVLFDTSASQALGFDAQVDRLRDVIAAIDRRVPADIPLRVVAFDQGVEVVFEGRLSEFGADELTELRARGALGASSLASALRLVTSQGEARYQRLLVMTDGAFTAGAASVASLRAESARLLDAGVVRIDVLNFGSHGDPALLRELTAISPNHRGLVLHGGMSPESVALRLSRGVVHDVTVAVEGSEWVYPQTIDSLQAGDDVVVYAGIDKDAPSDGFAIHLGGGEHLGRAFPVPLVDTPSPLLKDAWSGARASWLTDQARQHCSSPDRSLCGQWRQRALEWSTNHRVLGELTAMVVLPSTAVDYDRFASRSPGAEVSLDPAALPNILAVGQGGLEWHPRAEHDPSAPLLGSAAAYPLRFDLSPGPWWDTPTAPPPGPTVRQHAEPRSPLRRPRRSGKPVREDTSIDRPPTIADAEVPDKDAGGPRPGPHRTPEDAYEGNFLTVMNLLAAWNAKRNALDVATRWHHAQPGDVMALVALGEALEANGRKDQAARAYGSIIDLYPARADMRRLAASRLERLGDPHNQWLVLDSYGRALEQRSDDPAGHRLYAYALLRAGYYQEAFESLVDGLAWARSEARTRPLERVLQADLGLIAAAWIRRWPEQEDYVREALRVHEAELATQPSLRFVLSWDNELADLDLHVRDGLGWHAFYRHKALDSGGSLSDDMDAGYGLEAFIIDGAAAAFPYRLEVGYYARGAAHGGGKLEIVEHDGNGQLFFDQRPFVVLKQRAYVDLGVVDAPPSQTKR